MRPRLISPYDGAVTFGIVNMDFYTTWGFWVTLLGTILGIAGLAYGLWARNHPKRSVLLCRITESTLVPTTARAKKPQLQVIFEGKEIQDPHVAVVEIVNLGPDDLGPGAFEGGYLRLASSAGGLGPSIIEGVLDPVAGEVVASERPDGVFVIDEIESHFAIAPRQMKAGEILTITLLTAHRPDLTVQARLAGFDVRAVRGPKPQDVEFQIEVLGVPIRARMRLYPAFVPT